jgi:hypothetical protein
LTPVSMSLRQNCLSIPKSTECKGSRKALHLFMNTLWIFVRIHGCLDHTRSCDKNLPKEWIVNKRWRKTIPDNHLDPTLYKLNLGGCPHENSLSVTETWVFFIEITSSNEIHRSVDTTFLYSEDHVILVVILSTVRQSFPSQCLFQCWDPYTIHFAVINTLRVILLSCRDTPSFDTPLVTA